MFPDYPSLSSVTEKENWHSETEFDPWRWRTRFAADGVAAYGKFVKKKSVLISRELLPCFLAVMGSSKSVKDRYRDGEMSKEACDLHVIIQQDEGIDTRLLRAKAAMKSKEMKKPFDNGLLELQAGLDIVVSGTKEKQNDSGEKNGWNSTSYETIEHWTRKNKVEHIEDDREKARQKLLQHFSSITSPEAMKKIQKLFL
ncbi:AlkZ-related protein [Fictibacillus sp. NRS-1165]|uniref:AlkZ-related protein n=1 Tax=Fictibacillus sp. NRS-1165 TaxID=3144463 RepID=UPI003D19DA9A